MQEFITVKNASQILGVAPHQIRRLIKDQKIDGQRIDGAERWQIKKDSFEHYQYSEYRAQDLAAMTNSGSVTIQEIVEDVEELFEGDVVTYIMSQGIIEPQDAMYLNNVLARTNPRWPGSVGKKFKKIILVLHSSGGILEAAIKLMGLIKTYAEQCEVIVPISAKSAATIISLKADKLYMTPLSELGPVDPMVQSPSNPQLRVQAHVIEQFINHYGSQLQHGASTCLDEILREKLNKAIDPYLLGAYKAAQDFAEHELCDCFYRYNFKPEQLEKIKDLFLKKKSHAYPILYNDIESFGIGVMVTDKSMLQAIDMLMAIFNNYMASQHVIKVIGNRDINHNAVMPSEGSKQKSE